PSDDEYGMSSFNFSRWEDEELFGQINWTPNLHSTDASVEQQYYMDEASELANNEPYYGDYGDGTVDADTGIDIASSQGTEGHEGVNGSSSSSGSRAGSGMRRRSQPLRVRKSEAGTEWIEDDPEEEVRQAYGPSPGSYL
ncbi:hypothetical protein BGZ65_010314, partial [Modicella reniformis]